MARSTFGGVGGDQVHFPPQGLPFHLEDLHLVCPDEQVRVCGSVPRGWPTQRGSSAAPELVSSPSRPRRLGPDVTCSMICRKWCLKVAVFNSSYSQPRASAAWFAHSKRMNCFRPTARGTKQKCGGELLGVECVGSSRISPPPTLCLGYPPSARNRNKCPGQGQVPQVTCFSCVLAFALLTFSKQLQLCGHSKCGIGELIVKSMSCPLMYPLTYPSTAPCHPPTHPFSTTHPATHPTT